MSICDKPVSWTVRESMNLILSLGATRSNATVAIKYLAMDRLGAEIDYRPLIVNGEEIVLSPGHPQVLLQLPGAYILDPTSVEKADVFVLEIRGPVGRGGYL